MAEAEKNKAVLIAGLYAIVLTFTLFFLFHNLDSHLFWGDEAETAVLAKNVTKYGFPKTDDGINHITLYGSDIDGNENNVWTWSPWLQEYVAAASFKIFGTTTWAGRAPFACIGWLCLVLFGFTVHKIYRNHWITFASLLLLGTSEIFFLHARQCRYYSISVLGEILLIGAIHQFLAGNRTGASMLVLALVLQFYSNYIIAAANLPVLVILFWVLHRQNKRFALWLVLALGVSFIAVLPWLLFARPWQQFGVLTDTDNVWAKTTYYLREFHFHFLPWIFLLLPIGGVFLTKRVGQWKSETLPDPTIKDPEPIAPEENIIRLERLLLMLVPLYLGILLMTPGKQTRYLLPILPIACLLGGAWLFRYVKWRPLAVALLLIQCTNNSLSVATGFLFKRQHEFRWPLVEYVKGITHPYRDRFADVLDFLRKESHPGQTVFVFDPEFPLIFYTQLKIVDARLVNEATFEAFPDWVLSESPSGVFDRKEMLPDSLKLHYELITISVHDSTHGGGIPQPDIYEYETARTYSPFVLYKIRTAATP